MLVAYMLGGFLAGTTFGFTFLSALVGSRQHSVREVLPACTLFIFLGGLLLVLCMSAQLAQDAVSIKQGTVF